MEWITDGLSDSQSSSDSPIQNFTSGLSKKNWKLPNIDSGQNSLEYWDYTVELEMLKGPQDLQLAAELGKTLLERNRELESNVKHQQAVIDDQTQEIEYLSKQTAALREVNDSRLRIYEQLEISIQDLEKNNQRLTAESNSDKRKIINLSDTVEQLETKCEDLQKALEEAKLAQQRGRKMIRNAVTAEENLLRRSLSCENNSQFPDDLVAEFSDLKIKFENQRTKIKSLHSQHVEEMKKKEDLEIELSCLSQENSVLQEQLMILKEKSTNFKSFDDELASLDDTTTSSKFCKKCMGAVDETGSNHTMQDFADDFDDLEASYDSIHGECALVKLNNGGYAWGSQESLASMGQVVNCMGSNVTSPRSEIQEPPHNSLLSELDTQYRILIEKYEALVESREQQQPIQIQSSDLHNESHVSDCPQRLIHPCGDEVSGPMGIVMTEITRNPGVSLRCQRCSGCTCGFKLTDQRPKSNMEEFSEVETSSSGFSEGEPRVSCKFTQTELEENKNIDDAITPTAFSLTKCLDLTSPLNPCERRFQNMPIYKQLFQEIFDVLKKTVDENKAKMAFTRSIMQSHQLVNMTEMAKHVETFPNTFSRAPSAEPAIENEDLENKTECETLPNTKTPEINSEENKLKTTPTEREIKDPKHTRPDFLDLDTSRSSSTQRRRRRNRPRHSSLQKSDKNANGPSFTSKVPEPRTSSVIPDESRKSKSMSSSKSNGTASMQATATATSTATVPVTSTPLSVRTSTKRSTTDSKKSNEEGTAGPASTSSRCEHKSRSRKNKKSRSIQIVNKHLNNVTGTSQLATSRATPPQNGIVFPSEATKEVFKISHPSVEVAKLRKLEMSYAEVLKKRASRVPDRRLY